jgi:hypothetical protein
MGTRGLDNRLVETWARAAEDLGIRVTAPAELQDASGQPFACEALIHDFGSPAGAVVVSRKTERRIRGSLRSVANGLWVCQWEKRPAAAYNRKYLIEALLDWGWFGEQGREPEWYLDRLPRSA